MFTHKRGRKKIEIPKERLKQLREKGYSLREIAFILSKEDGIRVGRTTIWRALKQLEEEEHSKS